MPLRRPKAFTLIEAFVSLGVLLVAIALLIPTLEAAQRDAKTARCTSNLRLFMVGVRLYTEQHNGALPGSPWTSSSRFLQPTGSASRPAGISALEPIAPFDWATPVFNQLGLLASLKPNDPPRDRFSTLTSLRHLRCPENRLPALPVPAGDWPVVDAPSYVANLDYLLHPAAPSLAQILRNPDVLKSLRPQTAPSLAESLYLSSAAAELPNSYRPRLRDVGNPSSKVFLLEGTGRLALASGRITYPTDPAQPDGGYFARARPYAPPSMPGEDPLLSGNNADPTAPPTQADTLGPAASRSANFDGLSLLATARHGSSRADSPLAEYRINLAFFDGHIETRNIIDALDPRLHSPKGTLLDVRRATVYPRVTLIHLGGKERSVFVVP